MFFSESSEAALENGLRVAVMGGSACGKTSILNQYLHQVYKDRYWVTTGEIHEKELEVDGKKVQLNIWDTPGGYCFEAARQQAIRICDAFILVYSVHKKDSYNRILELKEDILERRGADTVVVVVATMTDLPDSKWFERPALMPFVVREEMECSYFQVTARKQSGISDIFCDIVRQSRKPEEKDSRKKSLLSALKSFKRFFKIR